MGVFPTHVGVFPVRRLGVDKVPSLPHARGGVSEKIIAIDKGRESSPRTWGCFYDPARHIRACEVFPTHVGVFPSTCSGCSLKPVFPTHVGVFLERGGS